MPLDDSLTRNGCSRTRRAFVDELLRIIGTFRTGVEAQRAQARRAEEMLAGVVERLRLRG